MMIPNLIAVSYLSNFYISNFVSYIPFKIPRNLVKDVNFRPMIYQIQHQIHGDTIIILPVQQIIIKMQIVVSIFLDTLFEQYVF